MVAPYEIGDAVRSFVKVPGSGTGNVANALFFDLSHVYTVAEVSPLPVQTNQESQQSPTAVTATPPEAQKTQSDNSISSSKKRVRQDEEKNDVELPPCKQIRKELQNERSSQNGETGSSSSVGTDTAGSQSSISIGTQTDLVGDEARLCNQLREQNQLLERRLEAFKNVFRNKERLRMLIKALEGGATKTTP